MPGQHRCTQTIAIALSGLLLFACGGDDDAPPPPECPSSYQLTVLPIPALSSSSNAEDINTVGQVVGQIGNVAATWSGGSVSAIPNTFGGFNSVALGINDSGHIVGAAETGTLNVFHAFLFAGGVMTDLGTLGGASSFASGINSAGQIVGSSQNAGGVTRAFLHSGGVMTDLLTLGGTSSNATKINNSGQIVGSSQISGDAETHAFLHQGGAMTDLGTLGGTDSRGFAVNDAGQVVGSSRPAGSSDDHAFLYTGGAMVDISPAKAAVALGLNNRGHVVGRFNVATSPTGLHAFRYCGGAFMDLNGLVPGGGAELLEAFDINDKGEIVGKGRQSGTSTDRAVLLTPS